MLINCKKIQAPFGMNAFLKGPFFDELNQTHQSDKTPICKSPRATLQENQIRAV